MTITDQLDPNLDWSTFELGEVVFGNTSVLLDGTPTDGIKLVDVPELGVVVQIEATFRHFDGAPLRGRLPRWIR